MLLVLTHLLAAVLALVLFFCGRRLAARLKFETRRRTYWKRQSAAALSSSGVWDMAKVPSPPEILVEREGLETALQTVSLADELGLLEFLGKKHAVTEEEIAQFLAFSPRSVRATVEVLTACGVIARRSSEYSLTEKARLYFLRQSPLYHPLPPARYAKRFLGVLRKGSADGAVARWRRGRSHRPEQWAMQQHLYSFPLGLALHKSGLLRGVQDVLDVAGGAGSVCIALALGDPSLRLRLIELPGSIQVAKKMIARYSLSDRIECLGKEMFADEWPQGMDAILFVDVFHNWSEERCQFLASKAFQSLVPGGQAVIIEALLNERKPGPLWTAHWTMAMALFMDGRQFRARELKRMLRMTGFQDVHVQPLLGYYSAVVGSKPLGVREEQNHP